MKTPLISFIKKQKSKKTYNPCNSRLLASSKANITKNKL